MRLEMVEAAVSPKIFREYPMLTRYRHCAVAQARRVLPSDQEVVLYRVDTPVFDLTIDGAEAKP